MNKFGYSALNGWDGNSIQINEEENYILSPQIGAGRKNKATNAFTGLLMGEMTNKEKDNDIGLLGFSEGVRTIFLDAQTGKAVFGSEGKGQIILDPTKDGEAIIKSGNYKDRIVSKDEKGDDVVQDENEGSGMKINLSKPYIKWGNENFSVNKDGLLKCVNATVGGRIESDEGHIGGWEITPENLFSTFKTVKEVPVFGEPYKQSILKTVIVKKYECTCIKDFDIDADERFDYYKDEVYYLKEDEFNSTYFIKNLDENNKEIIREEEEVQEGDKDKEDGENVDWVWVTPIKGYETKIEEKGKDFISIQSGFDDFIPDLLKKEVISIGLEKAIKKLYKCIKEVNNLEGIFVKDNYYWLTNNEYNKFGNENFTIVENREDKYDFDLSSGKSILYSNGEIQGIKFSINTKSLSIEPLLEMTRDNKNFIKIYNRSKASNGGIGFGIKKEGEEYKGVFSIDYFSVNPYEDLKRTLGTKELRWKETFTYHLNTFGNTFIGSSLRMKDPEYGISDKKWRPVLQLQTSFATKGNSASYAGSDLLIGAGGRTVLGSGESHTYVYNTYFKNNNTLGEGLFLTADSNMRLYVNCNDSNNTRYLELYNYGGDTKNNLPAGPLFRPDKNKEAYLGQANYRWKGIYTDYLNASSSITVGSVKEGSGSITVGKSISVGGFTVATQSWVEGKNYATKTDVPSLSGYATKEWANGKFRTIDTSYSKTYIDDQVKNLADKIKKIQEKLGMV